MTATSACFTGIAPVHALAGAGVRRNGLAAALGLACAVLAPGAGALAPGAPGVTITIPVSGTDDIAYAAVADPSGNVVMAGQTASGSSALAAITRAGQPDAVFGTGGVVTYNLSTSTDTLRAIVRMADGRYVGCGTFFSPGTANDFMVMRFMSDGSLDTTLDGAGYVVTSFLASGQGAQLDEQCQAVAVQSDGKIVSAGFTEENGPNQVALTRLTSDGQLDSGFGSGGKLVINAAANVNGSSEARALLVQPDGKLLIAGYAGGSSNDDDLLVMRLASDGTADLTFGTGGITRTPIGTGEDIANAMVLQPDGGIVVAGSSVQSVGRRDFVIARYTGSGVLDATFGTGGFTTTPIGPADDIAYALTRMPWGRFVAGGSARIDPSAAGTQVALVSYNADGSGDRYFGNDGIVMLGVLSNTDTIYALAPDIDGEHFWAIGTAAPISDADFLAVEFGLDDTIFRHGFDTNTAP